MNEDFISDFSEDELKKLELDEIRKILKTKNYSSDELKALMKYYSDLKMEKDYLKSEKQRGLEAVIVAFIIFGIGLALFVIGILGLFNRKLIIFYIPPFTYGLYLYKSGLKRMRLNGNEYKTGFRYKLRE